VQRIQVAKLKDVPEHVTSRHTQEGTEFDKDVYQVWDGRHRVMAILLLYGVDVEIPVEIADMTFLHAYQNCLIANASRDLGKTEVVHFAGLTAELTAESPEASFKTLKGAADDVTKWVSYQCIVKRADSLFSKNSVSVYDTVPKGKPGMTTPSYNNMLKSAFTALGKNMLTTLDEGTKSTINSVIETINEVYSEVETNHKQFAANLWTSYGSRVLGRVIGEAIFKAIAAEIDYVPVTVAKAVVKAVVSFVNGGAQNVENWNNLKPTELYDKLHEHAKANNIVLPRIKAAGGSVVSK
jgi:hypothetical protein